MVKQKQIFDIFSTSNEKKKTKKKFPKKTITVDYREKNSLVISELFTLGIEAKLEQLKVADYIVNGIALERKTVSDFISSMINKRLSNQIEELKQYPDRLLLIEGIDEQELYTDLEDNMEKENFRRGMHPNSVRGFLISILINHKIPIIFTKDYRDTARFISVIAKRKPRENTLNVSKKTLDKKERLQFILEGFPGIGPKTAKKLLKKHKTLKNIFNASLKELEETLGKKSKNIKKIIDEEY